MTWLSRFQFFIMSQVLLLTRIVSIHLYVSDHSQDSLDGPTRKIIILRKFYHWRRWRGQMN